VRIRIIRFRNEESEAAERKNARLQEAMEALRKIQKGHKKEISKLRKGNAEFNRNICDVKSKTKEHETKFNEIQNRIQELERDLKRTKTGTPIIRVMALKVKEDSCEGSECSDSTGTDVKITYPSKRDPCLSSWSAIGHEQLEIDLSNDSLSGYQHLVLFVDNVEDVDNIEIRDDVKILSRVKRIDNFRVLGILSRSRKCGQGFGKMRNIGLWNVDCKQGWKFRTYEDVDVEVKNNMEDTGDENENFKRYWSMFLKKEKNVNKPKGTIVKGNSVRLTATHSISED